MDPFIQQLGSRSSMQRGPNNATLKRYSSIDGSHHNQTATTGATVAFTLTPLDEFDDAEETVRNLVEEYKAAGTESYIEWGQGNNNADGEEF